MLKPLQHRAIALSTSLCVVANFLFLSFILYRELNGYSLKYLLESLIKITIVSVVMGAGAWWLDMTLAKVFKIGMLGELCSLFIAMGGAIVFYFAILNFIKINEVNYLITRISARLKTIIS